METPEHEAPHENAGELEHVDQAEGLEDESHPDPWGDRPRCGAENREGRPCRLPAGYDTDHLGEGRCKFHGGRSPIKHGRYSRITRPRIAELLEAFNDDPDPLNLLPEVQLLRALILDYVERYDEFRDALIAWHESYSQKYDEDGEPLPIRAKPRQITDITAAGKMLASVGALIERIQKQQAEGSVSLATLDRVIEQLGVQVVSVAQEAITDGAARTKFLERLEVAWGSIRLEPTGPSR